MTRQCLGCGAFPEEQLRGWRLAVDAEFLSGLHILWDGQFWVPCEVCNANGDLPAPAGALVLGAREKEATPAFGNTGVAGGPHGPETNEAIKYSTAPQKRQLAALVFYRCVTGDSKAARPQPMDESPGVKSAYRLVKLYSDGETTPIADDQIDAAIAFVTAHYQCRDFGYWLNDAQALVWATLPQDFERAWGAPTLRCACRYTRQSARYERKAYISRLVRVGSQGYIAPTRTGREVVELRGRFPTFSGDALWAPVEVMEAERQQEEELARRLAGAPHFAGWQARKARQEATLPWPYGK